MPHGQEQVIRGRKVKLSPVMVYSAASPYQGKEREREIEREGGAERERKRESSMGPCCSYQTAIRPILKTKCSGAANLPTVSVLHSKHC